MHEKLVNNVMEKNEVIQCLSSEMKTTSVGETRENETTAPTPVAKVKNSSVTQTVIQSHFYSLTPPQKAMTAGAIIRLS